MEGIAVHHDPRGDPQHLELIWFTVALQSQKLLIGAVYRPPRANNDILEYLDVNSFPKMTECGAKSILLIGAFNVHHQDWLNSQTTESAGRRTQQLSDNLGLQQIVKDPTTGENILDLAMTDLPATATTLTNISTSYHNPVLIQLEISASYDKPNKRKVWCYEKANFRDMRGYLLSIDWSALFKDNDNDPEKVCTKITDVICDAMDACIPSKIVTKKTGDKAWFDDKSRRRAKWKRRIYRKSKKVSTPENKE